MQIIDDVNSTIENLMRKEFGVTLPFDISFAVPSRDFSTVTSEKPTVNFYLYDIRENTTLRSNQPLIERRSDGTVVKKRPPPRIQLFYCITAWSPAQEDPVGTKTREEHKQLSKALFALVKYPTIPADVLSGDLIGQEPPLPTTAVLPDGMENVGQFWNALDGLLKPSLDYRITISLDVHEAIGGKMVAAKLSEYGSMIPLYVLAIRSQLRFDHPRGSSMAKANIEKTPLLSLDSSANQGDNQVTVSSAAGLSQDDFLMIVDGGKTEFCQLGQVIDVQIPIKKPLLYDHETETELKRLSISSDAVDAKLMAIASEKSTELRIAGRDASSLRIGEVYNLNDSDRAECFQITQVSGPEIGLGDSDTLIQFGGIVTNNATSPAPIVGAKITLLNEQGIYVAETISDSDGRYLFRKFGIGKGRYKLKVQADGYNDAERTIDEIASAKMEDFMFKLESG